jgi:curved DNA-binding protein CbpA
MAVATCCHSRGVFRDFLLWACPRESLYGFLNLKTRSHHQEVIPLCAGGALRLCSMSETEEAIKRVSVAADHYALLGVPRNADEVTIRRAYRKLAVLLHPDKNDAPAAEECFKKVAQSMEVLSDAEKRQVYDVKLRHAQLGATLGAAGMRTYQHPMWMQPGMQQWMGRPMPQQWPQAPPPAPTRPPAPTVHTITCNMCRAPLKVNLMSYGEVSVGCPRCKNIMRAVLRPPPGYAAAATASAAAAAAAAAAASHAAATSSSARAAAAPRAAPTSRGPAPSGMGAASPRCDRQGKRKATEPAAKKVPEKKKSKKRKPWESESEDEDDDNDDEEWSEYSDDHDDGEEEEEEANAGEEGGGASNSESDDGNDSVCHFCRLEGELLCCDGCPRTFHFLCLVPPMRKADMPEGEWFCQFCTSTATDAPAEPGPSSGSGGCQGTASQAAVPSQGTTAPPPPAARVTRPEIPIEQLD